MLILMAEVQRLGTREVGRQALVSQVRTDRHAGVADGPGRAQDALQCMRLGICEAEAEKRQVLGGAYQQPQYEIMISNPSPPPNP